MRHRVAGRKLGRTSSHRTAMRRAIVVSLFRHESITTTTAKAKEVRSLAERLITLAKRGGLANYRRAISELQDKAVAKKLFNEIAPRYADRPGGYTRVLRLSGRRLNDGAEQVVFELVGGERRSGRKAAPKRPKLTERRQERRADRETEAAEPAEPQAPPSETPPAETPAAPEAPSGETPTAETADETG